MAVSTVASLYSVNNKFIVAFSNRTNDQFDWYEILLVR